MAATVDDLIIDVMEHVFSFLSVEEIVETICEVNDSWKSMVQESQYLWNKLVFDPPCDADTFSVLSVLENAPKIKHVKLLRFGGRLESVIHFIVNYCTEIKSLHINQLHDSDVGMLLLQDILNTLSCLTTLGLYKLSSNCNEILKICSRCDRLKSLVISEDRDNKEPINFVYLAEGLISLEKFSYFSQKKSFHCLCDITYFLNMKKDSLLKLELKGCALFDEVLTVVETCSKLKTLNLEERSSKMSQKLNLDSLKQLQYLRLCGVNFRIISENICYNLVKLTLKLIAITDLSPLWGMCPLLQHVSIIGCDYPKDADEGFEDIIRCGDLRVVVIHNNCQLTAKTVKYVMRLPKLTRFVSDLIGLIADDDEEILSEIVSSRHLQELVVFNILSPKMKKMQFNFKVTYINSFSFSFQNKSFNDDYVV